MSLDTLCLKYYAFNNKTGFTDLETSRMRTPCYVTEMDRQTGGQTNQWTDCQTRVLLTFIPQLCTLCSCPNALLGCTFNYHLANITLCHSLLSSGELELKLLDLIVHCPLKACNYTKNLTKYIVLTNTAWHSCSSKQLKHRMLHIVFIKRDNFSLYE